MKIDELPRKAVLGYLELTRLPLTAAERALGKTEGTWPLTIAADRLQATIKDVAGNLLGDETLKADAKLQTAALDERIKASLLEEQAERVRTEGTAKVAKKAAAKKTSARKAAAANDDALERKERAAKKQQLAKEAKAVREERAAIEAKAEAIDLEDELAAARAVRKQA